MEIPINKKILLFGAVFCGVFAFVSNASAATLLRPPNNLGLVGYWSFDEGTSTKATDFSGQNNTGTLTNNPTWVNGRSGKALQFAGSNKYVLVPTENGFSSKTTGSISVWFYATSTNEARHLWRSGQVSADTPGVYVSGGNLLYHNAGQELTIASMASLVGRWHHVVNTWTGSGRSVYLDGVLVTSGATPSAWGTGFHIGSNNNDAATWNGVVDEMRLYTRTLTAAQVAALYKSGGAKVANSQTLTQGSSLQSGLVGHWTFDGGDTLWTSVTTGSTYDRSGKGSTGTLGQMVRTATPTIGKLGQAFVWTLADQRVNLGSPVALDDIDAQGGGGVTGAAWIYRNTGGSIISSDVDCQLDAGNGRWRFFANSSGALDFCKEFDTINLRVISGTGFVPLRTWTHVAYTWDGSDTAANVHLYVNGAEVSSYVTQTNASVNKESDAANGKAIGNGQFSGQDDYFGAIDDVRLYNRVLSATEVTQLYTLGASKLNTSSKTLQGASTIANGLVGLWTFDGADTTTTITDKSGQGNSGYFIGGATSSAKTIGRLGQAFSFNGNNNYVDVTTNRYAVDATSVSVSLWEKTTSNADMFLFSESSGSNNPVFGFRANQNGSANDMGFYFRADDSVGSLAGAHDSSTIYRDGNWHHFVGTRSGNVVTLYRDGIQVNQTTLTTDGVGTFTLDRNTIGAFRRGAVGNFFNGSIDDVRVYSRALSTSEVKQLYNLGK